MSILRRNLYRAQDGRCWICDDHMNIKTATLDHLWPKARVGNIGDYGVTLLAHKTCNGARGSPWPTDDEIRTLVRVYRRIPKHVLAEHLRSTEGSIRALPSLQMRAALMREFIA